MYETKCRFLEGPQFANYPYNKKIPDFDVWDINFVNLLQFKKHTTNCKIITSNGKGVRPYGSRLAAFFSKPSENGHPIRSLVDGQGNF